MIRKATLEDMDDIVRLAAQMHGESKYARMKFAPELLAMTAAQLIHSELGFAVVGELDGEIAGLMLAGVGQQWFSYELITFEYGIYVTPERRGSTLGPRMVAAYGDWAKSVGASLITAGVTTGINNDRAARLYEHAGFTTAGIALAMEV